MDFIIYKDFKEEGGRWFRWRWRYVASNGTVLAVSARGYVSKAGAKRAVWRLKETIGGARLYYSKGT